MRHRIYVTLDILLLSSLLYATRDQALIQSLNQILPDNYI